MLITRLFSLGLMVLVATTLCASVQAQEIDDSTKAQLRQLKKLCDRGLISAEVCKEKQRAILGLHTPAQGTSPRSFTAPTPLAVSPSSSPPPENKTVTAPPRSIHVDLPAGWTRLAVEELQTGREALLQRLKPAAHHFRHGL